MRTSFFSLVAAIALFLAFGGSTARGQTTATPLSDCTSDALLDAISLGGNIAVDCDSTLAITNTIVISSYVVLDGAGHTPSLDGQNLALLFHVVPGGTLGLKNITLVNGRSPLGGAIFNEGGRVEISNVFFLNNSATGLAGINGLDGTNGRPNGANGGNAGSVSGGAIYNLGGQLFVTNSVFGTNLAFAGDGGTGGAAGVDFGFGGSSGNGGNGGSAVGGAIYNSGITYIVNSTFTNNSAQAGFGGNGGVAASSGFSGTSGTGGAGNFAYGGAIFSSGTLTISNSTFAFNMSLGGNSASAADVSTGAQGGSGLGGGIFNSGILDIENCTVAMNSGQGGQGGAGSLSGFSTAGGNGGLAEGGGLFSSKTATIVACTFATNTVTGGLGGAAGSGLFGGPAGSNGQSLGANIANQGGSVHLKTSIVARNSANQNFYGAIIDDGFNISNDGSSAFTAAQHSRINTDPKIGPLQDNAGPTMTMALLTNSPAVNGITIASFALPLDQRGVTRAADGFADIGAFELVPLVRLSGRITQGTSGVPNVTVTATSSGISRSATTTSAGTFSILNLPSGTYVIQPTESGVGFSPSSQTLTVTNNVTNIVFVAQGAISQATRSVGAVDVQFTGVPQSSYQIQASSDFTNWASLTTITASTNGVFSYSDSNYTAFPRRFFRSLLVAPANGSGSSTVPPLP